MWVSWLIRVILKIHCCTSKQCYFVDLYNEFIDKDNCIMILGASMPPLERQLMLREEQLELVVVVRRKRRRKVSTSTALLRELR